MPLRKICLRVLLGIIWAAINPVGLGQKNNSSKEKQMAVVLLPLLAASGLGYYFWPSATSIPPAPFIEELKAVTQVATTKKESDPRPLSQITLNVITTQRQQLRRVETRVWVKPLNPMEQQLQHQKVQLKPVPILLS